MLIIINVCSSSMYNLICIACYRMYYISLYNTEQFDAIYHTNRGIVYPRCGREAVVDPRPTGCILDYTYLMITHLFTPSNVYRVYRLDQKGRHPSPCLDASMPHDGCKSPRPRLQLSHQSPQQQQQQQPHQQQITGYIVIVLVYNDTYYIISII